LNKHTIDLFKIDHAGLIADGLNEGADAQVAGAVQQAFSGANDQSQRFLGEGVVTQTGTIQLAQNESFGGLHGLVEAQAEDLNKEVNGVSGPVTLGPAPVAVADLFLSVLSARLASYRFWLVDRTAMVNVDRIATLRSCG
jgi:hypothetical protein